MLLTYLEIAIDNGFSPFVEFIGVIGNKPVLLYLGVANTSAQLFCWHVTFDIIENIFLRLTTWKSTWKSIGFEIETFNILGMLVEGVEVVDLVSTKQAPLLQEYLFGQSIACATKSRFALQYTSTTTLNPLWVIHVSFPFLLVPFK